jgi:nitrite reductase (NO-forming)
MSLTPPGRGRVVESHHIARTAFLAAFAFALVAVGWSIYVLAAGGSWWGPLHAFLAGTVLLAISGASQMFTITWSSTTPPPRARVQTQRWLIIAGVAAVLVGVTFDISALVWLGGAGAVVGVALLGEIIYSAIRKSLLRRFDLSARFYLTAFAAGVVGISLGTFMGAGSELGTSPSIRPVHAHLNLVGLVGLTIAGTIPTLLPTTAYSRAVSGREALAAWWMSLVGTVSIALGLWVPELVGAGVVLVALAGALILGGILWRLWEKGRHKLTFLQITMGTMWLIGWGLVDGIRVMTDGVMTPFSGWTGAVVLAGVGQVLAGSLAYLVPVLKGPPFEANRHLLEERSWLPLLALNAAGVALVAGLSAVAAIPAAVWAADFGVRLARVPGVGAEPDRPARQA